MSKQYYQFVDRVLAVWGTTTAMKLTGAPTEYQVTAAQAAALTDVALKFDEAVSVWSDPATRTIVATTKKQAARAALLEVARYIVNSINSNPAITDDQREELGIKPRKKSSSVDAPTEQPLVSVVRVVSRTVTARISSTHPGRRGRPAGSIGAFVYSFVGAQYPSNPAAWTFHGMSSKQTHTMVFPDSVPAGSQIWLTASYVNSKTQVGPPAVPTSTYLQIGGLSQAA